ncbi:hypothetical protein PN36_17380 [Candidatus Thiomargarita nelsonii]|uniref:LamG-like jellyroll fold domain-containing protein n=1 Tax=Candidatus Thiomargarita nelsonii TaxID=1003181 RepID=A0A0A6RWL0_9GAMM|nr:hypothetical protein PN36_17380 [Candidatus Thiomargarita nelsonii]
MTKLRCWLRTVLLMALTIGLSWFSTAWADLNDGLVAYYPFNGNANDKSGYGHHGIVHGARLSQDRFGNGRRAYSLDGKDDYVVVSSGNSLNIREVLTISVWVNVGTFSNIPYFVARYDTGLREVYKTGSNRGRFEFRLNDGVKVLVSNTIPKTGKWYHIAATYDGSIMRLYIDGVEDNSKSYSAAIYPSAGGKLMIGADDDSSELNQFLNGKIDDIRIYNRALSESEIQQLYQMNNQASNNCWAIYQNGNLHIPYVKVIGPFGDELHFEADMQYEPLSEPMNFQLTGAKQK